MTMKLRYAALRKISSSLIALACFAPAASPATTAAGVVIYVSPQGNDRSPGTALAPLKTLERAQAFVREQNRHQNVTVVLGEGTYELSAPLRFTAADGGRGRHRVTWKAAPGAHPLVSGGSPVTGWSFFDKTRNIYVASVPKGLDSRQLWVNGVLAERPAIEIGLDDIEITGTGFIVKNPQLAATLAQIKAPSRLEFETTGISEDRYSPVAGIDGSVVTMQQPAWNNNTWGYDTPNKPWNPEQTRVFLVNALELMGMRREWHRNRDQWLVDPHEGKLYFKPADGMDMRDLTIVLPRLELLLSIGGTYDEPARNLSFAGIRFSFTSWLGPSKPTGYVSQQSGAIITAVSKVRPADAFKSCGQGCPEFESLRELWDQMPAAVQVSAASNIAFTGNTFSQLGQTALGIGNDANANLTGVGLGASSVRIQRNRFAVLSGGAIVAGGVRRDAHHPPDARMIDKNILIANNTITDVAKDYKDVAAILSTYVDTTRIVHNDISDANYDAIDIGWGWGINDKGGNLNYRDNMKGYAYNPVYDSPTTLRNTVVAYNRIHGVKKWFIDGGSIYNLSANPGAVIHDNYIFDIGERIGIYLDEGSHYIRISDNVVDTQGYWLTANTLRNFYKLRATADNTAADNWHNSDKFDGKWTGEIDNFILDDHLVPDKNWPREALNVIRASGVEPQAGSDSGTPQR
jgi:hypothetical protein